MSRRPLCEVLVQCARALLGTAHDRGLTFLFDYRGPQVECVADAAALERMLRSLLHLTIERARGTLVVFSGETRLSLPNVWLAQVRISASGLYLSEQDLLGVLDGSCVVHRPDAGQAFPDTSMRIECPTPGVALTVHHQEREGTLLLLELDAKRSLPQLPPTYVDGAEAWLIASDPWAFESLTARLQRLGWQTRHLSTAAQALAACRAEGSAAPALVVGLEAYGVRRQDLERLASHLDVRCTVLLGLDREPEATDANDRVQLQALPFSTLDLNSLSRRAADAHAFANSAGASMARRPHALLVDDNPVNQVLGSEMLKLLGFETSLARDGFEAVKRCRERPPVIVLMDIQMPRMNGLQATQALRRLQSEGVLPDFAIVAATAYSSGVDEATCRQAGMDGYLHKPLDLETLRAMLRELRLVEL